MIRYSLLLCTLLTLGACTVTEQQRNAMRDLQRSVGDLQAQIASTDQRLQELDESEQGTALETQEQLASISGALNKLPSTFRTVCGPPPTSTVTTQCESSEDSAPIQVGVDKLLVGATEYVWLQPPGIRLAAGMDTGATSSSLHAESVVEFERDGQDWVRFDVMQTEDEAEDEEPKAVSVERPVERFVRVVQQADREGTRRPVVSLRVKLGNVEEEVEFTLADRSHLDNVMILGRNFLTDIALVDVARQFVQPDPNE